MADAVLRMIEKVLSRRRFLNKITTAAGAFLGGLVAFPEYAQACYGCCGLCVDPATCTWNTAQCDCVWCWTCVRQCDRWKCKECLKVPFTPPCYIDICACHNTASYDVCRYCNPQTIPCSAAEYLGHVPGCVTP
jgi:hypothetical protein